MNQQQAGQLLNISLGEALPDKHPHPILPQQTGRAMHQGVNCYPTTTSRACMTCVACTGRPNSSATAAAMLELTHHQATPPMLWGHISTTLNPAESSPGGPGYAATITITTSPDHCPHPHPTPHPCPSPLCCCAPPPPLSPVPPGSLQP